MRQTFAIARAIQIVSTNCNRFWFSNYYYNHNRSGCNKFTTISNPTVNSESTTVISNIHYCKVFRDVITEEEEQRILTLVEPRLSRRRYEGISVAKVTALLLLL